MSLVLGLTARWWRWIALLASMNQDIAIRLSADLLFPDARKRTAALLLRLITEGAIEPRAIGRDESA